MKLTSTKPDLLYGNITVTASPEELVITQSSDRSIDAILVQIAVFLAALLYAGLVFRHSFLPYMKSPFQLQSLPFLLIVSAVGISILRPLCGQRQVLRFSPTALGIEFFDFGRRWRHRTIPCQTVATAAYGLWPAGKSQEMGLRIITGSRHIDLLKDLKAIEAETILSEIARLGYRISYRDDLPEQIIAEQKRRNFLQKIYD